MKHVILILMVFMTTLMVSQDSQKLANQSTTMSGKSGGMMNCNFPAPLMGPTRSGGMNNNMVAKYRHLIPGLNEFVMPTRPTLGAVLSDVVNKKPNYKPVKVKMMDEYITEYNTFSDDKKFEMKNIFHSNWTQERFNKSESAIYRTLKSLEK